MRSFVALPVPKAWEAPLERVQEHLPPGRPAPPEDFHVTLAFLDDQPFEVLGELDLALEAIAPPPVALAVTGIAPLGRAPALIMAELAPDPGLLSLQRAVASAARQAGIVLERRKFRPHVTLMRYGKGRLPEGAGALAAALERLGRLQLPPAAAPSFALYRSTLTPAGAIHTCLADYPLPRPGSA